METQTLTPRQMDLLVAIEAHMKSHGECPTIYQLQASQGLKCIGPIQERLSILEDAGAISREYNVPRSIKILRPSSQWSIRPRGRR